MASHLTVLEDAPMEQILGDCKLQQICYFVATDEHTDGREGETRLLNSYMKKGKGKVIMYVCGSIT